MTRKKKIDWVGMISLIGFVWVLFVFSGILFIMILDIGFNYELTKKSEWSDYQEFNHLEFMADTSFSPSCSLKFSRDNLWYFKIDTIPIPKDTVPPVKGDRILI